MAVFCHNLIFFNLGVRSIMRNAMRFYPTLFHINARFLGYCGIKKDRMGNFLRSGVDMFEYDV